MTTPRSNTKKKTEKELLAESVASMLSVIECQIPADPSTGNCSEFQPMKSVWNEKELDILKTHLLDLATKL